MKIMEKENVLYEVFEETSGRAPRNHYFGHNLERAMAVANALKIANALKPISCGDGVSMPEVYVVVYRLEASRLTQSM